MGHSFALLTAALLVGQTPVMDSSGKNCPCKNGQQQGRVIIAQPDGMSETRTVSWFSRGSNATTTEWRSTTPQETSWVDNRPVLSRIRGWFSKSDNNSNSNSGTVIKSETVRPTTSQSVTTQPATVTAPEQYRRLPTTSEPPLATNPPILTTTPAKNAAPAVQPKIVAPATPKAAPTAPNAPLTIELEPIEFRPAGSAKGGDVVPATTPAVAAPTANRGAPSNRPNLISERFMNKVGQPGDYSWITGQLEIRNGQHLVHYASPETIDRFDGTVILSADGRLLTGVRSGDLVSVHGSITQQSGRNGVYRVQTIDLIER